MTLTDHLADCMVETKLTVGASGPAVVALRTALAADADMRGEAQRMIAAGVPVEPRDHVTRWRNALLRQSLGMSPHV